MTELNREEILKAIRVVPNFPKSGINFMDITTVLNNGAMFKNIVDHLADRYRDMKIDYIVGIESRGFLFGTALAMALGIGFIPVRKKGKLPADTYKISYELEYGSDVLEIHKDAFSHNANARVILVDDLLATGGTAKASGELIKMAGGEVVENLFVINLQFLNGAKRLSSPVYSILDIAE